MNPWLAFGTFFQEMELGNISLWVHDISAATRASIVGLSSKGLSGLVC